MKAIPLITMLGMTCIETTLAQDFVSTVSLSNLEAPVVDAPVFDAAGLPLGPNYRAELWGSTTPDSLIPAYDLRTDERVMVPFFSDPYEGYFISAATLAVPAQLIDGGNSWLQVRAWDSRLGSTYEDVAVQNIGGYGESDVFLATGANPYREPPVLPALLVGLESFSLRPVVPEPSAWALFALGALALGWAARRRRYS